MTTLLRFLGIHKHYFGVPHRDRANRLVKTCYECGKERPLPACFQ